MNTTKAKNRLSQEIENSYSLHYSDDQAVADGDHVIVYGERFDRGKTVDWRIKQLKRADEGLEIGVDVGVRKGSHQLVLEGVVHCDEKSRGYDFTDVSVVDFSAIDKCKDEIKRKLVQLWQIGWPSKFISNSRRVVDINENATDSINPISIDDFKVTTIRGRGKSMHLGWAEMGRDYAFKLGVNWKTWHEYMDATSRLKVLTHELIHCYHLHHKESFYREHARFVAKLTETDARKERVESLFEESVQWNKLKAMVLHGVHDQPKEINVGGHPHRRAACNALVKELEPILDYRYEVGHALHLYPPADNIRPRWLHEYEHDDPDKEFPSLEKLRPDEVEDKTLSELSLNKEYSDEQLYEYLQSLREEDDRGLVKFVYGVKDVPVVEEDTVIKNGEMVAMLLRMSRARKDAISEDRNIPTLPNKCTKTLQ